MTIGSLCSGYDGLAMGLQAVIGGDVIWQSENDKHASKILEARYPGVPNLGDLKVIDWPNVERVDWMCAGYPCQPESFAGKGLSVDDERWIWPDIARAIGVLRPRHLLLENVRGHLSRGFRVVLGSLASLGYDTRWVLVRASDAGAPHRRERLFVVATDACGARLGEHIGEPSPQEAGADSGHIVTSDGARRSAPDTEGNGRDEGRTQPTRVVRRSDAAERGDVVADTDDTDRRGSDTRRITVGGTATPSAGESRIEWGAYRPAIFQWERITERPAPRPTEPGRNGERLNPLFVEWMMGLPAGHVTDIDIPRNAQLKAIGNGCVPQQVALAVSSLLDLAEVSA